MTGVLRGTAHHVTIETLTTPRDGYCYTDRWWTVTPDGESVVFYQAPASRSLSPQCNSDWRVAEYLTKKMWPGHQVLRIPVAYLGHNGGEW